MVEETKALLDDFLHNRIDRTAFVGKCEKTYFHAISTPGKSFELDYLKTIPFIHELACSQVSDEELKARAAYFYDVLDGKQAYCYSSFVKLSAPDGSDARLSGLDYSRIGLMELHAIFAERIDAPTKINDFLYNSICDLLSNMGAENSDEDNFNYVNCSENVSFAQVKERVYRLLSYYCGSQPFLLQINFLPNNGVVCAIT